MTPNTSNIKLITWLLIGTAILCAPAVGFAAANAVDPVARWPLASLGGAIMLAGLALASVFRSWYELGTFARVRRWVGVIVASLGTFLIVFAVTEAPPSEGELPWYHDFERAEEVSRSEGKPMMVDFTADWCGACQELEAEVFHHERVRERLATEVVLAKVDFDVQSDLNDRLRDRFRVTGLPTVAFVDPDGRFLEDPSFEGKVGVDDFLQRLTAAASGNSTGAAEGEFAQAMREDGLLAVLLLIFFAGVMSSLTPCVYPLIPITIGLFGARAAESRWQAFSLSSVYVLGIVITYSILGVVAASLGSVFGGAMQNPWVLGSIAFVFLLLGLSSMGAIPFRLPGDLQTRLSQTGGTGYLGALLMGLVAGVIAAPCVGPIVAGILVYVAQQQSLLLGWGLLATFALGMGMLFLVLGTFSSLLSRIPKSGPWMEAVKTFFGVVFLAMALFYARFLIPEVSEAVRWLWLQTG